MFVPIALRTLAGNYFEGRPTNLAATLEYTNTTGFHTLSPSEGHAKGGQNMTVIGNFSRLGDDELIVYIGGQEVIALHERNDTSLTVETPPITLDPGEDRRKVNVTVLWVKGGFYLQNQTIKYEYKNYSLLTNIWPTHGPATGGTMV